MRSTAFVFCFALVAVTALSGSRRNQTVAQNGPATEHSAELTLPLTFTTREAVAVRI
jgi:hypothetical protein